MPKLPKNSPPVAAAPKIGARKDDPVTIALRQMHSSISCEPLPDDLEAILRQIGEKIDGAESQQ